MIYKNLLVIFLISINIYMVLNKKDLKLKNTLSVSKIKKSLNIDTDNYTFVVKNSLNAIFYFYKDREDKNAKKILFSKKYKNYVKFALNLKDKKSRLLYKELKLDELPVFVEGNNVTGFKEIKNNFLGFYEKNLSTMR